MALTTRRQFVQQTTLAATALWHSQITALDAVSAASEQNAAPLDAAAIRKLAAEITGHVITPDASDYESCNPLRTGRTSTA